MTKQQLRLYFQDKRMALSPKELENISEAICHNIFSNIQLEKKKISLFLPIERKRRSIPIEFGKKPFLLMLKSLSQK